MPAMMVARSASDWMLSKGKPNTKKCGSSFVSDTCALIAGCIRKYRGKQYLRERCNLLQEPHNCSHWADAGS